MQLTMITQQPSQVPVMMFRQTEQPVKTEDATAAVHMDQAPETAPASEASVELVESADSGALQESMDYESIRATVAEFNANRRVDNRIMFEVDESLGQIIVRVVDAETSEVIRQIPPEEMLRVARKMQDPFAPIAGTVLDKQG